MGVKGVISDAATAIFTAALGAILLFVIWSLRNQKMGLIHKLYLAMAISYGFWAGALICLRFTPPDNASWQFIWDACTNIGGPFTPVLCLCIALTFVKGWEKLPRKAYLLFVIPVLTNIVVWTNPWHHLQYVVFSTVRSEIVFGPYSVVSGAYCYFCLISSIALLINFARKNPSRLYRLQCLLVCLGEFCPLVVSLIATLGTQMPISATPLSFVVTIVLHGIAIYQLHFLDIKPLATQQVLDWISDCYLILSDQGLVLDFNQPFAEVFASRYGIAENRYLKDCVKEEDISNKTALYNLMTAIESCRESLSMISYEQAVTLPREEGVQKNYYITDVTSLVVKGEIQGFVVIFKDITQLKKSMQQLQDSQTRMMEQERLAFLGQMMGGLAHNLKTPIMSISGCISAAEALVEECEESLDDPEVVAEDYREIYGEIRDWFQKVRESSAYMSDIITAIKGQAASVSADRESSFTVDELIKRTTLLMRHELFSGGCKLVSQYDPRQEITLHGDINNLIQVLNNLISNAVYAQKQTGGGDIVLGVSWDEEELRIFVKDRGPGISPNVRKRLFKEMVTSKGTMGTGLGLYISNAVVRGKFGGTMWQEDNPDGGAIFGMSIPRERITIGTMQPREEVLG